MQDRGKGDKGIHIYTSYQLPVNRIKVRLSGSFPGLKKKKRHNKNRGMKRHKTFYTKSSCSKELEWKLQYKRDAEKL